MRDTLIDLALFLLLAISIWAVIDMDGAADFILLVGRTFYPLLPG
jgi:hypothetical protein